jgi:ectoine hydroxylase-related dioxygenase (phytanoyl-CoA dioxygenase family)
VPQLSRTLSFSASLKLREDALDFPIDEAEVQKAYTELTTGPGFYLLKQGYSREFALKARDRILDLVRTEEQRATHFTSAGMDKQKRVWNVQNKGDMFMAMLQHPFLMAVGERFLGDDFCLGSIATNTLLPGATGQEPHLDYPYWDYFNRKHWPSQPKIKGCNFALNMQVVVLLDDFTKLNGGTAYAPGTQIEAVWPNKEEFFKNALQLEASAGDILVFSGLMHHCAMPNNSDKSRSALLLQYLPKFVKPMEDMKRNTKKEILATASPRVRQLFALDYPYPANLDDAPAENSEGATAEVKYPKYD